MHGFQIESRRRLSEDRIIGPCNCTAISLIRVRKLCTGFQELNHISIELLPSKTTWEINWYLSTILLKIPSEKEVAPQYKLLTLLTLLTWFTLLTLLTLFILLNLLYTAKTLTCMPIYIVRKGWNSIRRGSWAVEQNFRWSE